MATSRPRSRALRPMPECLETRQLLSQTVSGMDVDGDTWVLKLIGPGDLRVTKEADANGQPQALDSPSEINRITIAGADPFSTRLVGTVTKGPNGDGRVIFSHMNELGGFSEGTAGTNGIYAIDMPDFWLGQTGLTAPNTSATSATDPTSEPSILIPDGVITLRFGGADTTYTPPGGTPLNTDNQSDTFTINLGLPKSVGTSILADKYITDAQAPGAPTNGQTPQPTQDGVAITVLGRINQFQANEIDGNTTFPSTQFQSSGGGGTSVNSTTSQTFGVTGQIGFVRVGGNATNFHVQTNDRISNYFIGGETNNVTVLAPTGTRNVYFGKGMDKVNFMTHWIDTLQANRGAVDSTVQADRQIGRTTIGGDVVDTKIQTGLQQNLASIYQNQQAPSTAPMAQDGGALNNVLIAGNITNSIFTASVDPDPNGDFGTPDTLVFPHGNIGVKVEGTIDNSTATPANPTQAFYAHSVKLTHGPVIPPSVPELPFPHPMAGPSGPRVATGLQSSGATPGFASAAGATSTGRRGTSNGAAGAVVGSGARGNGASGIGTNGPGSGVPAASGSGTVAARSVRPPAQVGKAVPRPPKKSSY